MLPSNDADGNTNSEDTDLTVIGTMRRRQKRQEKAKRYYYSSLIKVARGCLSENFGKIILIITLSLGSIETDCVISEIVL